LTFCTNQDNHVTTFDTIVFTFTISFHMFLSPQLISKGNIDKTTFNVALNFESDS